MTKVGRDIFNIFQENKDKYDLYAKLVEYMEKSIEDTRGEENAEFYEKICKLHDSINNAGCEERRSEQIEFIWKIQNEISSKYDDYLY